MKAHVDYEIAIPKFEDRLCVNDYIEEKGHSSYKTEPQWHKCLEDAAVLTSVYPTKDIALKTFALALKITRQLNVIAE